MKNTKTRKIKERKERQGKKKIQGYFEEDKAGISAHEKNQIKKMKDSDHKKDKSVMKKT